MCIANGKHIETMKFFISNNSDSCRFKLYTSNCLKTCHLQILTALGKYYPVVVLTANGSYYQFYMLANFNVNGISVTDTVFGESECLPLKYCSCGSSSVSELMLVF